MFAFRLPILSAAALVVGLVGSACSQPSAPSGAVATDSKTAALETSKTAPVPDKPALAETPRADGPAAVPPEEQGLKAYEGFTGFSEDESTFAYAMYSEGLGGYLLKVFKVQDGSLVGNQPIEEGALPEVKKLVTGNALRSMPRSASAGYSASVAKGLVVVSKDGKEVGRSKLLGGDKIGAKASTPSVWGVSPSGKLVAVALEEGKGAEMGTTRSFAVVPVAPSAP